jgi:ribosomal protein L5
MIWYDIYLIAIGLIPSGSSTYTFAHNQYREWNIHNSKKIGTCVTIKKLHSKDAATGPYSVTD